MSEPEPEAGGGWTHQIGKYRFNADQSPAERDGNFGKVYSAVDSGTGTEVALKLALEQTDKITSAQLNEILCQEACHEHQFVVSIKDVVYDYVSPALSATSEGKKQLAVVTEKMGGGELFVEATKTMGMPEDVAKMYFRQILLAVAHVHGRGVAHRDMKLANLLLNDDKTVCKVCDFGLAKHVSDRAYASSVVGAGEYIAPEIIATETKQYDAIKADMWACGVVLYCMVECRFPFPKSKGLVMNSVASPENAEMVERLMVSHSGSDERAVHISSALGCTVTHARRSVMFGSIKIEDQRASPAVELIRRPTIYPSSQVGPRSTSRF